MYYLIKVVESVGVGGTMESAKMIGMSEDEKTLQKRVKRLFNKALNDENVDRINDYDVDEADYDECGEPSYLSIMYNDSGFEAEYEKYFIVNDSKVKKPKKQTK